MTDRAAALTYYAMMSLFPALLLGITLLGLFGQQSIVSDASDYVLKNGADPATAAVVRKTLQHLIDSSGGALGFALVLSVVLALNGAAGAFGAAGRALNAIQGVEDDRGFVKHKLADLGATLVGDRALRDRARLAVPRRRHRQEHLRHHRARLDGGVGLVDRALAGRAARGHGRLRAGLRPGPGTVPHKVRWVSPGAAVGVVLWIVLSIAFAIYIKNFSSYGAAYGAFGAAIVLLLWLYVSANAFLFGAELNAELQRAELAGRHGPPPPSVGPRD